MLNDAAIANTHCIDNFEPNSAPVRRNTEKVSGVGLVDSLIGQTLDYAAKQDAIVVATADTGQAP